MRSGAGSTALCHCVKKNCGGAGAVTVDSRVAFRRGGPMQALLVFAGWGNASATAQRAARRRLNSSASLISKLFV